MNEEGIDCMDLVIFIVLALIVVILFKSFDSFVYFFAIIDILLRILDFLKQLLNIPELTSFLNQYVPTSILSMINHYSTGVFNQILTWGYLICFIVFEVYLIKYFMKTKRRR